MSLLPLDPSLARGLLAARELKCLEQVGGRGAGCAQAWAGKQAGGGWGREQSLAAMALPLAARATLHRT